MKKLEHQPVWEMDKFYINRYENGRFRKGGRNVIKNESARLKLKTRPGDESRRRQSAFI
jgi:hypothetical protein